MGSHRGAPVQRLCGHILAYLLLAQQVTTVTRVTTPAARRTQAERRSRSEEALLDAAAQLIAERGVERASLARIGDRAGLSRGLPTHHFGSKDALLSRLAERAQERIAAAMDARPEHQSRHVDGLSGLEVVYVTVDAYLELFEHPSPDERALLVMWGATFAATSSVEGMVEAERRSYTGLARVISDGQRDGSIRPDVDPIASAVVVLGMMRGTAALLLTDSALTDMTSVRRTCHDWIDRSLAAR
jgi:AcrR family transcriptional regulator